MIIIGLDMYLERHVYVPNYVEDEEGNMIENARKNNLYAIQGVEVNAAKVTKVIEEAAYWRKANAIHNWFVQNVQDGKDDCGTYIISKLGLEDLLATVNEVLEKVQLAPGQIVVGKTLKAQVMADGTKGPATWEQIYEEGEVITNPEICEELLPTADGFFFGSTEYDKYYVMDLQYTKKVLEEILNGNQDKYADYYYHSSW